MRLSRGYWHTYKETPAEAEVPSHRLMLRAGLTFKTASGLYSFLPMGLRVIQKIEKIVREEHNRKECFELLPPFVTPGELWKESGRWEAMGPELLRAKDRHDRDVCLSATNEETFTDIFKKTVKSYKELPVLLYQINTKFRDEIRPRYGVLRAREFIMKDAYSFHMSKECLDRGYQKFYTIYQRIFKRMGLDFIVVDADAGAMAAADQKTHEFQVLANHGEDVVIHCKSCEYAANIEKATTQRWASDGFVTGGAKLELVDTPNVATMQEACDSMNIPLQHGLKSMVATAITGDREDVVLVLMVGDDLLNELKLKNFLKADHIVPTKDEDFQRFNLKKGYIGPVKLSQEIKIVYDAAVDFDAVYAVGGGVKDKHYRGFIPSKQTPNAACADLRLARDGDNCIKCGKGVKIQKGIEVGHIFQLGQKYSQSMQATVLDENGKAFHPLMGSYGLGVTRTMAAAIEQNHDERGIIWPRALAPYEVYFAVIAKSDEIKKVADEIYDKLSEAGLEVIYDDRKVGPGFKFKDSELLGIPVRVVLGERDFSKDGMLEVTVRKSNQSFKVSIKDLVGKVTSLLKDL